MIVAGSLIDLPVSRAISIAFAEETAGNLFIISRTFMLPKVEGWLDIIESFGLILSDGIVQIK